MRLTEIIQLTEARLVAGKSAESLEIKKAFSSDTMSDVLTLGADHMLLISGLVNVQLIRTAEMADVRVVLLARGKKASVDMIKLANTMSITILETPFSIFRASGVLYAHGVAPIY